jgi:HlyD family secretion protein
MSKRWWVSGALLLAGFSGCGAKSDSAAKEKEAEPAAAEAVVTVKTEPARKGKLEETIEGLGRTEAIPDHLATLTPAVEGHVHELLVNQGDVVKKGQPIVGLDKAVASADLAEKEATRDGLKASLTLLKSLPRPAERKPNELAIEQAKVAVARAKAVADKLRPLLARHETSEQMVFDAEQAVAQALLQQQTAEATLHAMMIGPRPEAVAEAEAKIKTAEGAVEFSKAHLAFHTIRAPIDGVLDSLTCHPGQTISIGAMIGEVVDTRQVFASVWLPARSASSVRVGQATRVKPSNGSEGDEGMMSGKVAYVGRVADPQTGNLPVHVLVENPEGRLTLGETIHVTITVEERPDVLTVPSAAIVDQGEGPVLSVVRDGKTVALHPELGTPHGGRVAVSKTDLKEGEPVIVEGGYNLPEKTHVKVAPEKGEETNAAPEKGEEKAAPEKGEEHKAAPEKGAEARR